jgi:hypothetical protein
MRVLPDTTITCKGVWLAIGDADKSKAYDLCITDDKGWRARVTDCFWRKGGRHGKAGWYSASELLEGDGPAPVIFITGIRVTHCLEIPELPRG